MSVTAMKPKNAVESLREVVQDLLVPELKAVRVSVESLREEMKTNIDSLRHEMKISDDSLRNEMKGGFEALRNEMRLRDEKQSQALQALSDKLGYAIDIRERLAVLEDRVPRI